MPQLGTPSAQERTEAIAIDKTLILALRPEAARRGTTVARLVNDLLDAITNDGLVGAVLDEN